MSIHTSGPFWCGDGPNWQGMGSGGCARATFATAAAATPPNRPDKKPRRRISAQLFIASLPVGAGYQRNIRIASDLRLAHSRSSNPAMAGGLTARPAGRDARRGSSPDPQIRGLETVRGMDSNGAHRLFWAGLALSGEHRFVPRIGPSMSRLRWRMNTGNCGHDHAVAIA